jgi:hypothetical protein
VVSLVLVSPAPDYQLLSPEELRIAAGLASDDDSKDELLTLLGLEAAEWVATMCGVPAADGSLLPTPVDTTPTFRPEAVQETRVLRGTPRSVALARRFITGTVAATLDDNAFETVIVDRQAGTIATNGACGTLVVSYTAGFTTVPPALKAACRAYVSFRQTQSTRDPAIRSETIPDVITVVYRDEPAGDSISSMLPGMSDWLARYKTGTAS